MAITGSGKGIQIIVGADYNGRDLARAQRDLNKLQREAAKTQGPMTALGGKLKGMVGPALLTAGAAAAGMAVKLGVDAVQGAMAEQQELAKLQQALNNVGQGFKMPEVDDFISQMQMAYGVSDSDLRPAFQTLVTATGDVAQAMDLMNLAVDMNAGGVGDLASVSGALAKASQGNFKSLNSLTKGAIDPAILATKDLDQITGALAQKFGGDAAASADTMAGRVGRLQQAVGELSDSFGKGFLSAFEDSSGSVDGLQQAIIDLQPVLENFGKTIGDDVKGLGGLVSGIQDLTSAFDALMPDLPDWLNFLSESRDSFWDLLGPIGQFTENLLELLDLYNRVRGAQDSAAVSATDFGEALSFGGGEFVASTKAAGPWSQSLSESIDIISGVADEIDRMNGQLERFNGLLDQRDAARGYQAALDDLKKSLEDNGKQFKITTAAGQENQDSLDGIFKAAMQVADGQESVAAKAAVMAQAAKDANAVLKDMGIPASTRESLLSPFNDLIGQMAQGKVSKAELQAAIDSLQGKTVTVKAETSGAQTDIAGLKQAMEGIDTYIPVQIDVQITGNRWSNQDLNGNGIPDGLEVATGGYVRGPGGPTTDSIPARLSNGEFVIRAASVRQFGPGFFAALNRGVMPDSARLRGPMHGVTMAPSMGGTSSGFAIDTINVISAPGERAEESVPRALRRAAFLAGV